MKAIIKRQYAIRCRKVIINVLDLLAFVSLSVWLNTCIILKYTDSHLIQSSIHQQHYVAGKMFNMIDLLRKWTEPN